MSEQKNNNGNIVFVSSPPVAPVAPVEWVDQYGRKCQLWMGWTPEDLVNDEFTVKLVIHPKPIQCAQDPTECSK